MLTRESQSERSGRRQPDVSFTSVLMAAAWATGMSLRIFCTSVLARSATSVRSGVGSEEPTGADWTTNRKYCSRRSTADRNKSSLASGPASLQQGHHRTRLAGSWVYRTRLSCSGAASLHFGPETPSTSKNLKHWCCWQQPAARTAGDPAQGPGSAPVPHQPLLDWPNPAPVVPSPAQPGESSLPCAASQRGSYLSGRSCLCVRARVLPSGESPGSCPGTILYGRLLDTHGFSQRASSALRHGPAGGVSWGPQTHLDFITGPRSEPQNHSQSGSDTPGQVSASSQPRPKLHLDVSDWPVAPRHAQAVACEILEKV